MAIGWVGFAITSQDDVPASIAEEKALAVLKERHKIHPDDDRAPRTLETLKKNTKKIQGVFLGINVLVWIVGIGTLLAGVIGVSNIMLIIIKERTQELGIRRAIGATPFSVISQIVLEAITITLLAGILGLAIGTALLFGVSMLIGSGGDTGMFKNPEIDLSVAINALIVLIISGAVAGILPASRAVSISTVDALRAE